MTTRSIGTFDLGTPPHELEDAELWESFRLRGLTPEQATMQVQRRSRLRTQTATGNQADFANLLPGRAATAAVNFGHGASLGLAGDRSYLAASRLANPMTALASDIAGGAATGTIAGAAPIFAGASPAITGAVVGGGTAAARGFIEPMPGLSRTESALLYGTGGLVAGAAMGRLLSKLGPWLSKVGSNTGAFFAKALGKQVGDPEVVALTEAVIRRGLTQQKVAPEAIERLITQWKATPVETPPAPVAPPPAPVLRPGETVQVHTKPPVAEPGLSPAETALLSNKPGQATGLNVTGARATPPEPTAENFVPDGMTRIPDVGRGQTLPYYPRGGQVEQAFGPAPATSPQAPMGRANVPQQQLGAFVDYLKASQNPQDALARLATLKGFGIQGLPQEADLLAALGFPVPK